MIVYSVNTRTSTAKENPRLDYEGSIHTIIAYCINAPQVSFCRPIVQGLVCFFTRVVKALPSYRRAVGFAGRSSFKRWQCVHGGGHRLRHTAAAGHVLGLDVYGLYSGGTLQSAIAHHSATRSCTLRSGRVHCPYFRSVCQTSNTIPCSGRVWGPEKPPPFCPGAVRGIPQDVVSGNGKEMSHKSCSCLRRRESEYIYWRKMYMSGLKVATFPQSGCCGIPF